MVMEEKEMLTEQNQSRKIRAIIFVIATVALVMLWGGKVYASSMEEIVQGSTGVVYLEPQQSPEWHKGVLFLHGCKC